VPMEIHERGPAVRALPMPTRQRGRLGQAVLI
jgi:hypothetical protein